MIVHEPVEYFCPTSHVVTMYNSETGCWDKGDRFTVENGFTLKATIAHFSPIAIQNTRLFAQVTFDPNRLDPQWNYDFTNVKDSPSKVVKRGPHRYIRPCGYLRYAIKVSKLFDNGVDSWIGKNDGPAVWPVAYHGTNLGAAIQIHKEGFLKPGNRQSGSATLKSIYLSPDHNYAKKYAPSTYYQVGGVRKKATVILQARVKPSGFQVQTGKTAYENEREWLFEDQKDIRLYGILVKEENA